ncbi:uncharacterized protein AMSG_03565 [Thecamonas trahens ATCC 50062]|uniref:Secreted protein n=1 Tax=Thecamonas trahens ATCC 50062 TaxID=461836 RepID=A0A0L0D501_THETB|nr:hypothetical protein AMSG_03565 [Thecamonas trahens ATCC 50062]KNC47136.1 hypothetical protein AMSG_03565 [Thecamonas trahens ATCC 50062]|eukprot:XP_013759912.1 hypothetical protein AMSG_03565 [Thecamonas trahens ATCC 50062]
MLSLLLVCRTPLCCARSTTSARSRSRRIRFTESSCARASASAMIVMLDAVVLLGTLRLRSGLWPVSPRSSRALRAPPATCTVSLSTPLNRCGPRSPAGSTSTLGRAVRRYGRQLVQAIDWPQARLARGHHSRSQ